MILFNCYKITIEAQKSYIFSLCNFVQSPITSS